MNWKRIGRAALCLLVVCCLILNMSPLRADALVGEIVAGVALSVAAVSVVAATLIGLGVMPGTTPDDFDTIVDECVTHLSGLGMVANGLIDVFLLHEADGMYSVKEGLVTAVAQWMYDREVVTETAVPSGYAYYNGVLLPDVDAVWTDKSTYPYVIVYRYSGTTYIRFTSKPYYFYNSYLESPPGTSVRLYTLAYGPVWSHNWDYTYSSYDTNGFDEVIACNYDIRKGSATGVISFPSNWKPCFALPVETDFDLSLGEVASSDTAIADGYTTWAENAVSIPGSVAGLDDESIPVWPIALGGSYEDTRDMTQENVWTGASDYGAQIPVISADLSTKTVTYEQGALTSPLVVSASVTDGGILGYQWYVSVNGGDEQLIEAALSPKYTPPSDVIGTYAYRCHITNVLVPFPVVDTWSSTATVAIVAPGSITVPDSDVVTHTGLKGLLGNLASTIAGWFGDLITAVKALPAAIADAVAVPIRAIFVPSEDFITAKVQALRANYAFADSIMSTGKAIGNAMNDFDTSPPIIYMELSNAESQYNWGGRAIALDLRWYERYKPTVDQLLSALLWIFFAWRVFRKLPGIIGGMEGDAPFEPVSDGRFSFRGYASDSPRLGSGSLKRRD